MPRRGLDRAAVVAAAARIADAEGLSAATVTRVASDLGVRGPSLYNHVGSGEELQRRVALLALEELTEHLRDAAVGRSGPEAARSIASAYRRYALAHPGRYAAMQTAPEPRDEAGAAAREIVELLARVLAREQADGAERVHRVRAWRSALHGFVDLERSGGFRLDVSLDESYDRLVDTLLQDG